MRRPAASVWGSGGNEYGLVSGNTAKGACSLDGTGYWVVGDPQRTLYVANGASTGTVVNSNANSADFKGNLQLQGCAAYVAFGALPRVIYFVRTTDSYFFLDQTTIPTENWAVTMTVPRGTQWPADNPWAVSQVRRRASTRTRTRTYAPRTTTPAFVALASVEPRPRLAAGGAP